VTISLSHTQHFSGYFPGKPGVKFMQLKCLCWFMIIYVMSW